MTENNTTNPPFNAPLVEAPLPSPSKRLHEVTMAALRRAPSSPEHTVDLTRNAKGDVQIAVAVRGYDLDAVADDAARVFDTLCAKYPRPGTNGGGDA